MFLSGSYMTIGYYKLENSEIMNSIKKRTPQLIISVCSIFMFLYGFRIFSDYWSTEHSQIFKDHKNIISGVYWSIFLFFMLIGHPNCLTNIFAESNILKNFGRYSFGIYLLHPAFSIIRVYYKPRTGIESLMVIFVFSYFGGVFFFYFIENHLINLAYKVCKIVDRKVQVIKSKV